MDKDNRVGKVEDMMCASCERETAHTILASYKTTWGNEDIWGGATHEFLSCNGCKTGTYRTQEWCTEDEGGSFETLHPPRGGNIRQPKDFHNVPWESLLNQIYKQTITAFNADLLTLAGGGVRLLIEGVCKEQGVTEGPVFDKDNGAQFIDKKTGRPVIKDNLEGKINGMAEKDLISKKQAKHLHEIRFLGNDSVHEPYIPEAEAVSFAVDIVEHIFDQVYEQPQKAEALAERKRPTKK